MQDAAGREAILALIKTSEESLLLLEDGQCVAASGPAAERLGARDGSFNVLMEAMVPPRAFPKLKAAMTRASKRPSTSAHIEIDDGGQLALAFFQLDPDKHIVRFVLEYESGEGRKDEVHTSGEAIDVCSSDIDSCQSYEGVDQAQEYQRHDKTASEQGPCSEELDADISDISARDVSPDERSASEQAGNLAAFDDNGMVIPWQSADPDEPVGAPAASVSDADVDFVPDEETHEVHPSGLAPGDLDTANAPNDPNGVDAQMPDHEVPESQKDDDVAGSSGDATDDPMIALHASGDEHADQLATDAVSVIERDEVRGADGTPSTLDEFGSEDLPEDLNNAVAGIDMSMDPHVHAPGTCPPRIGDIEQDAETETAFSEASIGQTEPPGGSGAHLVDPPQDDGDACDHDAHAMASSPGAIENNNDTVPETMHPDIASDVNAAMGRDEVSDANEPSVEDALPAGEADPSPDDGTRDEAAASSCVPDSPAIGDHDHDGPTDPADVATGMAENGTSQPHMVDVQLPVAPGTIGQQPWASICVGREDSHPGLANPFTREAFVTFVESWRISEGKAIRGQDGDDGAGEGYCEQEVSVPVDQPRAEQNAGYAVLLLRLRDAVDGEPFWSELEVVKRVLVVLNDVVRAEDGIAHLGGPHFGVLQLGLERREDAAALARRIIAQFLEPDEFELMPRYLEISLARLAYPLDEPQSEDIEAILAGSLEADHWLASTGPMRRSQLVADRRLPLATLVDQWEPSSPCNAPDQRERFP